MTRRFVLGCTVATAMAVAAACGGDDDTLSGPTPDDGVRVASFDFTESAVLAELYAQVVESTGTPVVRLGAIGPREIIAPALELGQIDLVPEYLGTALQYHGSTQPDPDPTSALSELDERLSPRGLTALGAAPAEDKNIFVVTLDFAERTGVEAISDLAPLASSLQFGGPPECADRSLCLAGLRDVYGLEFAEFVPQRSLTFTAEALRREEISVGLMFSTAAEFAANDLVALDDDRAMQPAENIVPVIRSDALSRWGPQLVEALDALSKELTTNDLRILNVRAGAEESIEEVARDWLEIQQLVPRS